MNLQRTLIGATIVACMVLVPYWFFKKDTEKSLVLGTMSGWPPFVSINQKGSYEGLDIDLAKIIAERLGKKLIIKDMDTALLINALQNGQVDFVMTGLDMTPERMKRMTMIPYQGKATTSFPLIFWKKVPEGIGSLDDLKNLPNAVICVESGSSQEEVLKRYTGFAVKNLDPLVSLLELKLGRATAVLLDDKLFKTFQKKEPDLVALSISLDPSQMILGCGIGINRSNTKLIKEISSIIEELKQTGVLSNLEAQWIPVSLSTSGVS